MSINRRMDKDVYTYTIEYYSAIKKNEITPFAATWMDLEMIILSEAKSDREEEISYDILYMLNLKRNDTNEFTNLKQTHRFR